MKRITSLFLAIVCLLTLLAGCQKAEDPTPSVTPDDPKLSAADLAAIPVATAEMTAQERRQLIVDFMDLQRTFQWTSNVDLPDQPYASGKFRDLLASNTYTGIPYQTVGSGSPYRWLEYYDEETGIMDFKTALAENGGYGEGAATYGQTTSYAADDKKHVYESCRTFFNACSQCAGWAWARVVNSVRFDACAYMNVANGFIPVGCFSYGYDYDGKHYGMESINGWGIRDDSNPKGYDVTHAMGDIKRAGGKSALYDCYAQLKPGDCLVSSAHTMLVRELTLAKNEDGTLDYQNCYVTILEQSSDCVQNGAVDGKPHYILGQANAVYYFDMLEDDGYLPFTFAELLDENDPQDKKHLDYYNSFKDKLTYAKKRYTVLEAAADTNTVALDKGRVFANKESGDITAAQFQELVVGSNYLISDVFVTVTNASGETLLKNIRRCGMNSYEVAMTAYEYSFQKDAAGNFLPMYAGLAELAGQGNTVTVTMQISTGELLTVFIGALV